MFLDLVRQRRSVRKYLPRPVEREKLERCLEAARLAPSACNSQPWRFIVVDDPALRERVGAAAFSGAYAMNSFARGAPVLIAVITGRSSYAAQLGGFLRGVRFSLVDIGIACEHLVLQAEEEGLGSCWLGWFDAAAVKRALGLPRKTAVDVMLSVGYPADGPREKRRKNMDETREYNGGRKGRGT